MSFFVLSCYCYPCIGNKLTPEALCFRYISWQLTAVQVALENDAKADPSASDEVGDFSAASSDAPSIYAAIGKLFSVP